MFGIGGSKSKSTGESSSYGYSGSTSESFSQALSQGLSGSTGRSFQELAFADLFADLYGNAGSAAARAADMAPGLSGMAEMLFSSGTGFLDQLAGGQGADYMASRLSGSGLADERIAALGEDISRFMSNEIMPGITSRGVATGTLGGGRQGVAQGLAAEGAAREFARGATAIRGEEQAARDSIAAQLAGLTQAGAGTGLGALPGLFGLGEAGAMAELTPYMALAQIMGGPQALTTSASDAFSQDFSTSMSRALAEAFGEDWSQSKTKSSSGSFSFGLGG